MQSTADGAERRRKNALWKYVWIFKIYIKHLPFYVNNYALSRRQDKVCPMHQRMQAARPKLSGQAAICEFEWLWLCIWQQNVLEPSIKGEKSLFFSTLRAWWTLTPRPPGSEEAFYFLFFPQQRWVEALRGFCHRVSIGPWCISNAGRDREKNNALVSWIYRVACENIICGSSSDRPWIL